MTKLFKKKNITKRGIYTWWGKCIGAFLGYLIAGPAGAFLGILIGNFFDRGLASHFTNPFWDLYAEKRKAVQDVFFEATFSVLGYVAKTDGHVSVQEINMANQIMQEMRLSSAQKHLAQQYFTAGKQVTFDVMAMVRTFKTLAADNLALLRLFLDIQYRASLIDGLTREKLQVLNRIFNELGFASLQQQHRFYGDFASEESTFSQQRNQGSSSSATPPPHQPSSLAHAFALLQVNPLANRQEVKRAYRRLMSINHPDKLIAQGKSEALIKAANEKTQQIRKAYDQICASKGW